MNEQNTDLSKENAKLQAKVVELEKQNSLYWERSNEFYEGLNAVMDKHGIEINDSYAEAIDARIQQLEGVLREVVKRLNGIVSNVPTYERKIGIAEEAIDIIKAALPPKGENEQQKGESQ